MLILALLSLVSGLRAFEGADQSMAWWGLSFTQLDFALGSAAAFGAWALLGAYRSMCNELEIRTTPWALPAFIVFTAMYFAGFALRDMHNVSALQSLFGIAATGVVVAMVFSYGMLLAEKSGATEWQRLRARLRARQWHRAWQELPLWLVALATGFVMALTASIAGSTVQGAVLRDIGAAPIALILFAVRDAAIFQFFALARRPGRVVAATLFYLLLLYGVLPGLLSALGADIVAQFILPPLSKNAWFATIVIAVQAAIAVAFTYARWRKIHAPDTLAQTGNLPLERIS